MEDYFTMMMLLNMDANQDFDDVREELHQIGRTLGVKISIQNQEIFDTMHKL